MEFNEREALLLRLFQIAEQELSIFQQLFEERAEILNRLEELDGGTVSPENQNHTYIS